MCKPTPSPVNTSQLETELTSHPDRHFVNFLMRGFNDGFDTGITKLPVIPYICKNLLSATKQPQSTMELLQTELERGYVIGPYDFIPFSCYRISLIGIAVGKYSGKKRLIVDLSAPHDNEIHASLNELINKEDFSLSYVTIDNAIKIIVECGKGAQMCKVDIRDAFKLIPINESLWPFYGIQWDGRYYFYTKLVFGSRSSPKIFDFLSEALCWILRNNYNVQHVLHLLDDFLTIDNPDYLSERTMAILTLVFNKLNIPLSVHKTTGPATVLEYLGVVLDSIQMEARLPLDKIKRISSLLETFINRSSCTKRELLSLLGHLNFACRVIYPGRAFVSYLIALSASVKHLHHRIKLTSECRMDIKMWSLFLEQWNGKSFFMDEVETDAADMQFFTDATPEGFGGYYQTKWFHGLFDQDMIPEDCKASMALYELYYIVMAVVLWGDKWCRKRILVNCDNEATVEIINKGRSKIPFIMKFVRKLVWFEAKHNFVIRAKHIRSAKKFYS